LMMRPDDAADLLGGCRYVVSHALCKNSTSLPSHFTGVHFWIGMMFLNLQPMEELYLISYRCATPSKPPALPSIEVVPWFPDQPGERRHGTLLRTLSSTMDAAIDHDATQSIEYIKGKLNKINLDSESDQDWVGIEKLLDDYYIRKWILPTASAALPATEIVRSIDAPECCIVCREECRAHMRMLCCVATVCVSCCVRWFSAGTSSSLWSRPSVPKRTTRLRGCR